MTPKEKAEELFDKMSRQTYKYQEYGDPRYKIYEIGYEAGKKCALIAVDEIIKSREDDRHFDDSLSYTGSEYYTEHPMYLTFWLQVKQEIEKL